MEENKKGTWLFNAQTGELVECKDLDEAKQKIAVLEEMRKQRKIYEENKKMLQKDRKDVMKIWNHNCYLVDKIGEAIRKNRTHIFIHVPERLATEPLFLTHAEDTKLIIEVLQQRKKELEFGNRSLDFIEELNELRPTKTEEEYNEKLKEVSDKMTAMMVERNAEWLAIVINLKNAIKKDTNTEMSDEEWVYHARRIYNISLVLYYMLPSEFRMKKGGQESFYAKEAYHKVLEAYTKKNGQNPVWNGEELKPLPEWKKDEPEHDMWTFRIRLML